MAAIAEFTLPAGEFPLGQVFEHRPEATVELDRFVPSGDTVIPYFWVESSAGELLGILEIFKTIPELRSVGMMADLGEKGLFRVEWSPEYLGVMRAITGADVTVLSATGSNDGWLFEIRAQTGDALAAFQRDCTEHSIEVTLTRLSRLSEITGGSEYGLTPAQREALVLAYAGGYYNDTRETNLEGLSAQFGITRQALSARLRRGYRNLIEHTLIQTERDER